MTEKTKRFNSLVVIHKTKLKIAERRTLRKAEETETARQELSEKYSDSEYDVVVTYGGPFDILNWMLLRQLEKTEIHE
jgi:hypothetical protein